MSEIQTIEADANANALYRKNSKQLSEFCDINVSDSLPDLCLLHSQARNRNNQMAELLSNITDPN